MRSWTAVLPCTRLIPSSLSVCVTASAWLGRRTTDATLGSPPADCARRSAPVPARRGWRPCRDRAAGVVALSRGTAAGAHAPLEPHPSAALALLSATARGERR